MISCGREVTAPQGPAGRVARGLAFSAQFPEAMRQLSGGAASLVPFTKVRVLLQHSNGTIALETVVDFTAGSDPLTLGLTVPLLAGAPASGEPMTLSLAYINAAGDTVFRGGPLSILVVPSVPGQAAPAPVQVLVSYAGPGANAAGVKIAPKTLSVAAGDNFTFTGTAVDASGATIANTPIVWTTLDPTLATITAPGAGAGTAKVGRGTVLIQAQLLTGPADVATLFVGPKASTIAAVSGGAQSGAGGLALPLPVVVKVTATDALPMAGVAVTFGAANGGAVGATTVTTDASGLAQTTWTLGPALGAQTLTATVAGLSGSPVTFGATSTSGPATQLVVTTAPTDGYRGIALRAIAITAQDASGNVARAFTGPVTVALAANPGSATLGGTATVNAVAGVASFTTLTVNQTGVGYTLRASASGLTAVTTPPFTVIVPPATRLGLVSGGGQTAPAYSTLPVPVVVQVVDVAGNDMLDAGRTVTFTATDGGSVSPASATTDALGRASGVWNLGSAVGSQTMTAASGELTPLVVRATATPSVGRLFTWLGAVDTSWTNPANWSPTGVPGANDDVYIDWVQRQPTISTPTSVKNLGLGSCSGVQVMNTLTISGSVADSSNWCLRAPQGSRMNSVGVYLDTGTVILTGTGTLMGEFWGNLLMTGGTHTVIGDFWARQSLTIGGTARLILNGSGGGNNVYGSFATTGSGTLQMTNANDVLALAGDATFAGGSETGLLTAGEIYLNGGNFTQAGSPTAFAASGTHKVQIGSGRRQTVTFANPTTSFFQDLDVFNWYTEMALASDVTVKGTLWVNAAPVGAIFSSANGNLLTVAGLNIASAASFTNVRLRYVDGVAAWRTLSNVSFSGFSAGATFFEFARTSGGPYDFTGLTFSGPLNPSGRYVVNTGSSLLNLISPNPTASTATTACGCAVWFTPGSGGVTWP